MNRIDEDIRKQEYSRFYLLYGEEDYLKRAYRDRLKKALVGDGDGDSMNLNVWRDRDLDLKELRQQAQTLPFFAQHRLIIVEDSGLFKKGGAELAQFLPSVPEETVIVFVEHETDAREKLFKEVKKLGVVLEMGRQKEEQLISWAVKRLSREGKQIQRSAVYLLMERAGEDMQQISNELEKLISYTADREAVMLEDVQAITPVRMENRIFDMIDAIGLKQQDKAMALYRELIFLRESPVKVLVMMGKQFERVLQVEELRALSYSQNAIADRLGMRSFIVRKALQQGSHFTQEELKAAIESCVRADERIKQGRMKDVMSAQLAILEITNQKTALT